MTAGRDRRAREAERRLRRIGVPARVEAAGEEGDMAVLRADADALDALLGDGRERALGACRAAGFRYVSVELF